MKIRNIVFSGFMASILMAGGAYATDQAGYLTTKTYVDTAYQAAVNAGNVAADTAEAAAKDYADGLNDAMSERMNSAESSITTLTGTGDGSVAKALADAKTYTNQKDEAMNTRMTSAEGKLTGITTTVTDAIAAAVGAGTSGETISSLDGRLDTVETWKTSITADAAELNILDGATVTTTELNYVDGVTSNIQEQLNGKVAAVDGYNLVSAADIAQITTNKNNIATLNGNASTAGSVAYAVAAEATARDNAIAVVRGETTETVASNAAAIAELQENTACSEGNLCYIDEDGKTVEINTVSNFDSTATNLDVIGNK